MTGESFFDRLLERLERLLGRSAPARLQFLLRQLFEVVRDSGWDLSRAETSNFLTALDSKVRFFTVADLWYLNYLRTWDQEFRLQSQVFPRTLRDEEVGITRNRVKNAVLRCGPAVASYDQSECARNGIRELDVAPRWALLQLPGGRRIAYVPGTKDVPETPLYNGVYTQPLRRTQPPGEDIGAFLLYYKKGVVGDCLSRSTVPKPEDFRVGRASDSIPFEDLANATSLVFAEFWVDCAHIPSALATSQEVEYVFSAPPEAHLKLKPLLDDQMLVPDLWRTRKPLFSANALHDFNLEGLTLLHGHSFPTPQDASDFVESRKGEALLLYGPNRSWPSSDEDAFLESVDETRVNVTYELGWQERRKRWFND